MKFAMINTVIFFTFVLGFIFLQIYLSKRENKWLGLILPIISFLYSILIIPGYLAYSTSGSDKIVNIIPIIITFIYANIPTVIYLLIYFICREKIKKKKELDKMKISDL